MQRMDVIKAQQQTTAKTGQLLQPEHQHLLRIHLTAAAGFMPVRQRIGGDARQLMFRRFEKMTQKIFCRTVTVIQCQPDH